MLQFFILLNYQHLVLLHQFLQYQFLIHLVLLELDVLLVFDRGGKKAVGRRLLLLLGIPNLQLSIILDGRLGLIYLGLGLRLQRWSCLRCDRCRHRPRLLLPFFPPHPLSLLTLHILLLLLRLSDQCLWLLLSLRVKRRFIPLLFNIIRDELILRLLLRRSPRFGHVAAATARFPADRFFLQS